MIRSGSESFSVINTNKYQRLELLHSIPNAGVHLPPNFEFKLKVGIEVPPGFDCQNLGSLAQWNRVCKVKKFVHSEKQMLLLNAMLEVIVGMHRAFQKDIAHANISPGNIMITEEGFKCPSFRVCEWEKSKSFRFLRSLSSLDFKEYIGPHFPETILFEDIEKFRVYDNNTARDSAELKSLHEQMAVSTIGLVFIRALNGESSPLVPYPKSAQIQFNEFSLRRYLPAEAVDMLKEMVNPSTRLTLIETHKKLLSIKKREAAEHNELERCIKEEYGYTSRELANNSGLKSYEIRKFYKENKLKDKLLLILKIQKDMLEMAKNFLQMSCTELNILHQEFFTIDEGRLASAASKLAERLIRLNFIQKTSVKNPTCATWSGMKIDFWIIKKTIAEGSMGIVHRVKPILTHEYEQRHYAVKIPRANQNTRLALKDLSHAQTLLKSIHRDQYVRGIEKPSFSPGVQELFLGTLRTSNSDVNFHTICESEGIGFQDRHEIFLNGFKDLLCGLSYIHSEDILHVDIKPENIALTKKEKGLCFTLIDWEGSYEVSYFKNRALLLRNTDTSVQDMLVYKTRIYFLEEIRAKIAALLLNKEDTIKFTMELKACLEAHDIASLGMSMIAVLKGDLLTLKPFPTIDSLDYSVDKLYQEGCSPAFVDLLKSMISASPPSAEACLDALEKIRKS